MQTFLPIFMAESETESILLQETTCFSFIQFFFVFFTHFYGKG